MAIFDPPRYDSQVCREEEDAQYFC